MSPNTIMILVAVGAVALVVFGLIALFIKLYRKVEQGKAMIVNTMAKEPEVTFTGRMVIPVLHKVEIMDIALKTIEIDRRGKDGLICQDNIRADIKVAFFVKVNKTKDDVLKVAQAVGCARASDQVTLEELFSAKFSEALKTVGKQMDFEDLYRERDKFRDDIVRVIGDDLNGYSLEDAAIDYLEQTPVETLDPQNILDAQGIRKITRLTALQHVETNNYQRDEQMQIKKKDVEAREAILELERQQADAEAKQQREVQTVMARESAETEKVRAEELQKTEQARISAQQEIDVQLQNKQREVEIAEKNRERAVAIETEKVNKVRELEIISRERETELQRIDKEKALEEEKKEIAEVIRGRVAVEKTVAEEEERIKEVRVVSEADRSKQALIIAAEAEAQEKLVKEIKEAEAGETTAKHRAAERLTMAQAEFEASEKEAEAKIRLATGTKAEAAAPGLARAQVEEANAVALEKTGEAEAKVLARKMAAEAEGKKQIGDAEADVLEGTGMAEVRVKEADAKSEEEQKMVEIKIETARAEAIRQKGTAEADAIAARFKAEADGLKEKFAAMATMEGDSREHEEFRMLLDTINEQVLAGISANKDIAKDQAEVLARAMEDADIQIIGGGEGDYMDKFVKGLAVGKQLDGVVSNSDVLQQLLASLVAKDGKIGNSLKGLVGQRGNDE